MRILCFIVCLGSAFSALAEDAFYASPAYAKPSLSYNEIDQALQAHPLPVLPLTTGAEATKDTTRKAVAKALNAHIYWEGPRSTALADFYRGRIRRALEEIAASPAPESGVLIWKFYSSGVVVKSKEGVFAFDVVEGPVPPGLKAPEDWREAAVPEGYKRLYPFPLSWDEALRRRYADLVDVQFVTHLHYDHLGGALVRALLAAGKTVVMPEQAKTACLAENCPKAEAILTLPQNRVNYLRSRVYEVGGIEVITYHGYQDEYEVKEEGGRLIWELNTTDPAENYVYIARIGGVNIFHNGDVHHCPTFYPWLVNLVDTPWAPDLCLTVPWFENWKPALGKLFPKARITVVHELEVGHTKFSEARPPFRFGLANAYYLMWGEQARVAAQR